MDFDHREKGKTGSGRVSETQLQIARRDRLFKLAMETSDVSKNPYLLRNHLGKIECRLCLTVHNTEANFLAHTQGRRHLANLARRQALENRKSEPPKPITTPVQKTMIHRTIKIGRPGYQVVKQRDSTTGQNGLLFEIQYPEIESGLQPRHRFMSAFEQKVQAPDKNFQYLIFAAAPYENIAFKIPNKEIDKGEGRFTTRWNTTTKVFQLQMFFKTDEQIEADKKRREASHTAPTLKIEYYGRL